MAITETEKVGDSGKGGDSAQGGGAERAAVPEKRRALGRGLASLLPGGGGHPFSQNAKGWGQPEARPKSNEGTEPTAASGEMEAGRKVAREAQVSVQSTHANLGHTPDANLGQHADAKLGEDAKLEKPADVKIAGLEDEKAEGPVQDAAAEVRSRVKVPPAAAVTGRGWGAAPEHGEDVIHIPVGKIRENQYQTRTFVDEEELKQLASSIQIHGVLQPVVVRPMDETHYMLIMGSRRWQASKMAGMETVPAIVRRVSAMQAAEMTIIENLQREDLSCLDEARAFLRLSSDFGQTQEQIGERMGMARETVSNYMRLLRLPKEVQFLLDKKHLDYSQARQLLRINSSELQIKVAQHVVKRKMSVEQLNALLDRWAKDVEGGKLAPKSKARYVDPNVQAAQRDLERILGLKVKIRDRKGKGKITLEYASIDEFDRVVTALKGKRKN